MDENSQRRERLRFSSFSIEKLSWNRKTSIDGCNMGGLSRARRKEPPPMLDLSIRDVDNGQATPTLRPVTSIPRTSTPKTSTSSLLSPSTSTSGASRTPTLSPSSPSTPTRTLVQTTTRVVTTKLESPTATIFITIAPVPQTITVNPLQTVTTQPDPNDNAEQESSVAQPGQGITFTSHTGVVLLAVLGSIAGLSLVVIAFVIVWRKRRQRTSTRDAASKLG
ncbi:hypothetical protein B0J13DRAFT_611447 [Dactylonectria estremocensis]|uniref:Uncharacterized protein n=1 Tax=Dactylonectria estremocensis TaxID=1079267 RepID=A0A9P9DWM1_9HYPO|nr:hypothetical protein B0J13DRAFT_611447 [Dactylonectria estremocensis]